jgi:DNA-binding NtrC family response regulator
MPEDRRPGGDEMKKILLVDDEEAIRVMVRAVLNTENRSFAEASNGDEAQAMLDAESFDLVISDVIMPDCDGIELVMAIRRKLPNIPVVVMSGGGRVNASHYLDLAEKLGAMSVFEKPFNTVDLRKAVARILGDAEPATE